MRFHPVGLGNVDGRHRLRKRELAVLHSDPALKLNWLANLTGVEIDYDCPTSKLPAYARFLVELRSRLARRMALSITALPTWMNSAARS